MSTDRVFHATRRECDRSMDESLTLLCYRTYRERRIIDAFSENFTTFNSLPHFKISDMAN